MCLQGGGGGGGISSDLFVSMFFSNIGTGPLVISGRVFLDLTSTK